MPKEHVEAIKSHKWALFEVLTEQELNAGCLGKHRQHDYGETDAGCCVLTNGFFLPSVLSPPASSQPKAAVRLRGLAQFRALSEAGQPERQWGSGSTDSQGTRACSPVRVSNSTMANLPPPLRGSPRAESRLTGIFNCSALLYPSGDYPVSVG